jgi:hypothetical protein
MDNFKLTTITKSDYNDIVKLKNKFIDNNCSLYTEYILNDNIEDLLSESYCVCEKNETKMYDTFNKYIDIINMFSHVSEKFEKLFCIDIAYNILIDEINFCRNMISNKNKFLIREIIKKINKIIKNINNKLYGITNCYLPRFSFCLNSL